MIGNQETEKPEAILPTFYVDPAVHQWKGKRWGHLMTPAPEADLVAFARRLGLKPEWIQKPGTDQVHFDLTAPKREEAIRLGAVPVAALEMFKQCVITKRKKTNPANAEALEKSLGMGLG